MDSQSKMVVITAECLCKSNAFNAEVAASELPLDCNVCHCTSCRHASGGLYVVAALWPQPREDVNTSGLSRYQFSNNITNWFCGTCSTLMFCEKRESPGILKVFTGALRNINDDLVRMARHIYVEDTIDGGATVWLRKPNSDGEEVPRYKAWTGDIPWTWPQTSNIKRDEQEKQGQASLPLRCHCNGVDLRLHSGDYASTSKEELPAFIDPRTLKPVVTFDVCDSCRLQFGNDIVYWTFTEWKYLSQAEGGAFPQSMAELRAAVDRGDLAVGTLAYHRSSPKVQRYFCKLCCASVFFTSEDQPRRVDVSVGMLDAPDGARAESFVSWNLGDEPDFLEDTKGGWREAFIKKVQVEAEDFRIANGYPKSWERLENEAKASSS